MSVPITGRYLGNKKMELTHGPSGSIIKTDAPQDVGGEGSTFSPTDLCGAALGSCIITTMAIVAERHQWSLAGSWFSVEKHMSTQTPRKIEQLPVIVHLPQSLTAEQRTRLEAAGKTCPVHHSLHAEIKAEITFVYDV